MSAGVYDAEEAYRQTQSQIYGLQETLLNSTKTRGADHGEKSNGTEGRGVSGAALASTNENSRVDSKPVLRYVLQQYGQQPDKNNTLGTLTYHPYREAATPESAAAELPFPFDSVELAMPKPFLAGYGHDKINRLVTVKVSYEDLKNSVSHLNSPRSLNNEIWGCQIYTDDSDPVLVLRHCGVSLDDNNGSRRTPANLDNEDDISGTIPPKGTPFDLEADLLLLPPLQNYESVLQHGVRSRSWGNGTEAVHDGLSYGLYSIRILARDTSTKNIDTKQHQISPSSCWDEQKR